MLVVRKNISQVSRWHLAVALPPLSRTSAGGAHDAVKFGLFGHGMALGNCFPNENSMLKEKIVTPRILLCRYWDSGFYPQKNEHMRQRSS